MSFSRSVLVTGSAGFVGRETVLALTRAGWNVVNVSRSKSPSHSNNIIHLDLADPHAVMGLAKGQPYDAIVHLGALVGWSDSCESEMYITNTLSTAQLAYLANSWNAQIIYASTAIVHGILTETINSETIISLDNNYAKSKWMGEQVLKAFSSRGCILRMAGVFGQKGPRHLGLNRSIDMAIEGIPPVQVGEGGALRNYIYVKDVAHAICYALEHDLNGTHLLAGHEELSFCEMLSMVCSVLSPSITPTIKSGEETKNQLVKPSSFLPKTRDFVEALIDIRENI